MKALPLMLASLMLSSLAWAAALPPEMPIFKYKGIILDDKDLRYNPHQDLIFPSVIAAHDCFISPLGRYYLYYAPHDAPGGICLAFAGNPAGPWHEYTNNPIITREWPTNYKVSHVSGPHALWNPDERKLFLYYHGENPVTRLATSTDGIHFHYDGAVVHTGMFQNVSEASYGRVFRRELPGHAGEYVMLLMGNNQGIRRIYLATSKSGREWEPRRAPLLDPPPGTDQVAGAWYLSRGGKHYFVAHANNSKAGFNQGYDLYLAETDAAFEHINYLGKFMDRTFVSPTNEGVMSPCFFQEQDGAIYLFFNIGARLRNKIALAIAQPAGQAPTQPPGNSR